MYTANKCFKYSISTAGGVRNLDEIKRKNGSAKTYINFSPNIINVGIA